MVLDYFFFVCILASLSQFAHAMSFPGQYPAKATGLTTIYAPGGVQIRYKEPHICETTPGVRSYSGYVDLNATTHMYVPFHHGLEPIAANWRNLFVFLCFIPGSRRNLECHSILRRCLGAATYTVQVLLVFRVQEQSINRSHHSMAQWRSRQCFSTRRSIGYFSSNSNPGTSSYLLDNGPCWVKQQSDVASPEYNIFSRNNYSNILYLDQPIGTGFSYSEEQQGSLNPITGELVLESIHSTPFTGSEYP
jgi:Serine carboxypeptidase